VNHTSADLLEFEALRTLVGRYISSAGGRSELERIAPESKRNELHETLAETGEAMAYLASAAQPQSAARGAALRLQFDGMADVRPHVTKLSIEGVVLEGLEIREVVSLLDRACDIRAVVVATEARFPRLAARAARIAGFRPLVADLSSKIEPDGRVADHASVALQRIRRDIERQQRLIRESLERFLKNHRDDGVLQEEFVTIRNERFVLPVVTGQQRKVEGIIHAASGTGHTLFVEPLETVELNNDLVRLQEQERREVFRILEEITWRLRSAIEDVAETAAVLGELEVVFAKARFGADFHCVIPKFSSDQEPRLVVKNARHPLLEDVLRRQSKRVVPLSLELSGAERTLIISGPNTGGKTVALKTVGMIVLIAQSGLPVPCDEAELPLFEEVLADIGDNQSIEQSLSTFSAHVERIKEMVGSLGSRSLVLLDELGRATDPDEGGALGVAILDRIRQAGAFTLASTHLLAPKIYGSTTEGVVNASMSFDEETLAPTYVLRVGAPGASAGLEIARRIGLPVELVEQARLSLSSEKRDIARFLRVLEERLENTERLRREIDDQRKSLEAEQSKWRSEWEKREAAKLKEIERRTELLLEQFQERAEQTIERLAQTAEQKKFAAQAQRKVAQVKREMREELQSTVFATQHEPEVVRPEAREGTRVRLRGVREPARVRRMLGKGVLEVEAGFLKLQVSMDDVLEVLPETPEAARLPTGVTVKTAEPVMTGYQELNVIGRRAEEAVDEVDRFLDRAALGGLSSVRIVHGHGMGVLKRAIADLLKSHPHVEKFSEASLAEGGAGATIVHLRVD